ncbi:MAG: RHS repeat-associated core domain-containing protein, partial [Nitrospirota bacterium]
KFTGQEEDAETGLYYYGARYYDPVLGRFVSADSIVQDPFEPQTLNRYSYVINNPLKYVDPNGHFFLELLIASMVIGAVSAGIQSHWNIGEMARGAVMAGATAGVMAGIGATVSAAIQASLYANASQSPMYASNTLELNMVFENTYSISAGIFSPGIERAAAAGMFYGGIAGGVGGGMAAGSGGWYSGINRYVGNNVLSQNYPSDYEKWFRVFATREGLVGKTTASGRIIRESDVFVALPAREALNTKVELFYQGKTLSAPVWDVGPWNTRDPYWLTRSRPQAESGRDLFGRKTNKAGIDLSNEAFRRLGLRTNDWIYWRFIDE